MLPLFLAKKVFGFAKNKYDDRYNQNYDGGYEKPRRAAPPPLAIFAAVAVLFSLIGIVLATVAIIAGQNPGTITDGYIVQLNTSKLGKDIPKDILGGVKIPDLLPIKNPFSVREAGLEERTEVHEIEERQFPDLSKVGDTIKDAGKTVVDKVPDVVNKVPEVVDKAKDGIKDVAGKVNDKINEVIEDILKKLGIKGVYNLHVMNICNGDIDKDKGGAANISFCTVPLQTGQNSVLALLDKELAIGPLKFNIAKLGIVGELQEKINDLTSKLNALAAIYIIGAGCAGLGLLTSVGAAVYSCASKNSTRNRLIVFINLGLFSGSAIFLLAGSMITTLGANIAVEKINEHGGKIGLSATTGMKFRAISWSALAFVLVAMVSWLLAFFLAKPDVIDRRATSVFGDGGQTPQVSYYGEQKEVYSRSGESGRHSPQTPQTPQETFDPQNGYRNYS